MLSIIFFYHFVIPATKSYISHYVKLAFPILSSLFSLSWIISEVFETGRLAMLGPHLRLRVLQKLKLMNRYKVLKQSLGYCVIASGNKTSFDSV